MWTATSLATHLDSGAAVDFLFFWGHTPKAPDSVDASCLSQWFPRAFAHDGVTYSSAEHFMMAEKARLFGDDGTLARILAARTPADAKQLGREVQNYVDDRWAGVRLEAVVRGNVAKFTAHADLQAFLLGTGERILVEAAPRDTVWGIGLGAANPRARNPREWRGQNLLGFALTEVRRQLRAARIEGRGTGAST
jgi:ribA/ribD-fused uncharacterized protein